MLRIEKGLDIAAQRNIVIQDSETGLWISGYFENCRIAGKIGCAKRHGRELSLLLFRLQGLDAISSETLEELSQSFLTVTQMSLCAGTRIFLPLCCQKQDKKAQWQPPKELKRPSLTITNLLVSILASQSMIQKTVLMP